MAPPDENTPLVSDLRTSDSASFSTDESSQSPSADPEITKQGSIVIIFAIWSSMMGTSLLVMPWGFQQAGLIQGLLLNVALGALSGYTAVLVLNISERFVDDETGIIPEFAVVCTNLLGRCGTILTTLCSAVVLVGALVVYWILMSELLFNSVNSLNYFAVGHNGEDQNNSVASDMTERGSIRRDDVELIHGLNATTSCPAKEINVSRLDGWSKSHVVSFFLVIILAPLIHLRSSSFFTRFGAVGCVPVIFLVLYSVIKSAEWGVHLDFQNETSVHYAELFSDNFPAMSGVLTMAFFMHNSVITLFRYAKTPEKNTQNLCISYVLVLLTYGIVGVCIYIAFPLEKDCIKQNFFENISIDDPLSLAAQIMILFRLITLFPLVAYILRVQIFVPTTGKEYPGHFSVAVLNLIVMVLCLLCGAFYPSIGYIVRIYLRYVGVFCGVVYMFLLPCLTDAILQRREEGRTGRRTSCIRCAFHAFIVIFGAGNFFTQFAVTP